MMQRFVKYLAAVMVAIAAMSALAGCRVVDNNRIPSLPVYVPFNTQADWITYGVAGACETRNFILSERVPSNYPWTSICQTGFGGVMLCSDIHNMPVAYDLACPVEVQQNVRVVFDRDLQKARCPKCRSVYDIFANFGAPVSGPAAEYAYGLLLLRVGTGPRGEYMAITH